MVNYLLKDYLREWRTKKEILDYLKSKGIKISERDLRRRIQHYNKNFYENETFIAHSRKGYLITTDQEIIKKSLNDDKKRALNLLEKYYKNIKNLGEKNQIKLGIEPYDEDIFEMVMKVKECQK